MTIFVLQNQINNGKINYDNIRAPKLRSIMKIYIMTIFVLQNQINNGKINYDNIRAPKLSQ